MNPGTNFAESGAHVEDICFFGLSDRAVNHEYKFIYNIYVAKVIKYKVS